jgi:hypothetical protein
MASIARDKNGSRRILFVAQDGKRPTIRLGKVSQRSAEALKRRVEEQMGELWEIAPRWVATPGFRERRNQESHASATYRHGEQRRQVS